MFLYHNDAVDFRSHAGRAAHARLPVSLVSIQLRKYQLSTAQTDFVAARAARGRSSHITCYK